MYAGAKVSRLADIKKKLKPDKTGGVKEKKRRSKCTNIHECL